MSRAVSLSSGQLSCGGGPAGAAAGTESSAAAATTRRRLLLLLQMALAAAAAGRRSTLLLLLLHTLICGVHADETARGRVSWGAAQQRTPPAFVINGSAAVWSTAEWWVTHDTQLAGSPSRLARVGGSWGLRRRVVVPLQLLLLAARQLLPRLTHTPAHPANHAVICMVTAMRRN
jgi:hypothetical protein